MRDDPKPTGLPAPLELVTQALAAIRQYKRGGSRGALLASDRAASASVRDPQVREAFERGLLELLSERISSAAAEHACRQLGLIGTAACAGTLIASLGDPERMTAACSALDAIREPAVDGALRAALPKARGMVRVAIADLLGRRRDAAATRALGALVKSEDPSLRDAAIAALASIGNRTAAAVLRVTVLRQGKGVPASMVDACLRCAEQFAPAARERLRLLDALDQLELPSHARQAVRRARA